MSNEMREQIDRVKNWKQFLNENTIEWDKDKVASEKVNPPQYIYHISEKQNRNGIFQNGLKASVGDSYKGWTKTDKSIPAIFATIGKDLNDITGGLENFQSDIWRIDTTKSDNDWFVDKHFEKFKDFGMKNPHIVTFSSIPRNAIDLIDKQI